MNFVRIRQSEILLLIIFLLRAGTMLRVGWILCVESGVDDDVCSFAGWSTLKK